jgi:hypothetical protein
MREFKNVPVGGGYTVHLIKRVGGNKYFRHNRFLQIHMSFLLQKYKFFLFSYTIVVSALKYSYIAYDSFITVAHN